jgi:hypothetical protein
VSRQRRRGQWATVYPTKLHTDARGNEIQVPDMDKPQRVRAVFIPQRSSKAEVPGQMQINVTRMLCDPNLEGVTLWARVEWAGKSWDLAAPPAYHHGPRRSQHWSIDIRQRP